MARRRCGVGQAELDGQDLVREELDELVDGRRLEGDGLVAQHRVGGTSQAGAAAGTTHDEALVLVECGDGEPLGEHHALEELVELDVQLFELGVIELQDVRDASPVLVEDVRDGKHLDVFREVVRRELHESGLEKQARGGGLFLGGEAEVGFADGHEWSFRWESECSKIA